MNSEVHNYYTLASTVIECVRDGMLSAQKLEEMKHNFYVNSGQADATEAQREDGSIVQQDGATEVDIPQSKYFLVSAAFYNLHKEKLCNLYSSPNIIRVIKSRRIRWAGHVACIEALKMHLIFKSENRKERDNLGDIDVNEMAILKQIFKRIWL
jgi:hypothetical protein